VSVIHRSPLPEVDIPDVAITTHVLRKAADLADQIAIRAADGSRSYTYVDLSEAIHSLAGGLAARGVAPGTVVGLMAPNIPEFAVVFHGVAVAGGAITTLNPSYGPEEIRHQLLDAGATILVTMQDLAGVAEAAIEGTRVDQLVLIGDGIDGSRNATPLQEIYAEPIGQVGVDPSTHTVVLPYSSGTTGLPKGVMLTHRNLVANIEQVRHALRYREGETALAALPFFHIYGMSVLMNGLLANGVEIVTMPRFDLEGALGAVQAHGITRFFAVPPIVLGLARSPIVDDYDLSSLRQVFSGAAPLGAELAIEASTRLGCEVVQGYGMSELSPVSHCTVEGDARPGTNGVTVSNTESRIVDVATGGDLSFDLPGELWVRGPQVMVGYLNNPEATASTIDEDGWLHTGDVAIIDGDGHMTIVDRLKELIKFKGFQVAPAELEALLITHPAVADVAVIGVPDPEAGEVPKAVVVEAPGHTVTLAALQDLVEKHLVAYKQVRELAIVDEIPRSSSGKVLRRQLRSG